MSTTRQAGHMAKRKVGVEFSQSMLEPVRPGAASADRAKGVVLIDLESLLDCPLNSSLSPQMN